MLVAANKVDLVHVRAVSEEAGRELARALGAPYIETSAKEPPLNIDAAFHEVSRAGASLVELTVSDRSHLSRGMACVKI